MDKRTYDVLIKPVGDKCNLKCGYCYYSGKGKVLGQNSDIPKCLKKAVPRAKCRQRIMMCSCRV